MIEFNSWQEYSVSSKTRFHWKRIISLFVQFPSKSTTLLFYHNRYMHTSHIYNSIQRIPNVPNIRGSAIYRSSNIAMIADELSTLDSSRKEEVPPFKSVGSSLCSRDPSRPTYNHNAFNVKRRSDTVGVAWPVDLWEMAEVRSTVYVEIWYTRRLLVLSINIGARNLAGKGQFQYGHDMAESSGLVSFGGWWESTTFPAA